MENIADSLHSFLDWLLTQDPLYVLLVLLLIRGEVRTEQALRALKLLRHLHIDADADPKMTLKRG